MEVSILAFLVAGAAGTATGVLAARRLRGGRRIPVLGAAIARGLAVALAVFAAFSPSFEIEERTHGVTLVAAPADTATPPADLVLRWHDDARDAATALETLRASRDGAQPATLVLVAGDDLGRGRDFVSTVRALRRTAGVDPVVLPLPAQGATAAMLPPPRILVPAGAVEGVAVTLVLDAGETPFAAGEAHLSIGARDMTVTLPEGARRVAAPAVELPAGGHLAVAEVPGRLPAACVVDVAGPPRVLVVVEAAGGARSLVASLRTQGLEVADVAAPDLTHDDLARAAVVVLGPGVTAGPLAGELAIRVREGAGLLVLGGAGAAGLSRFRGGELDPLLPVDPPVPPKPPPAPPEPTPPDAKAAPEKPKPTLEEGKKQALRVALLLVVDTSGSMAGHKLVMAQQSAIAAAGALSGKDRVSVISFDDEAHDIAHFQDATDLTTLYRRIAALTAGGGTNFLPALKIGFARILAEPCGIRHVILVTDGETRPAVFRELVDGAAARGVTLSTIAVGDSADTRLLALLAEWGKGRLYLANDPARLPEVVTLDTQRFAEEGREKARRKEAEVEGLPAPPTQEKPAAPTETKPPADESSGRDDPPPQHVPHVVTRAAFLAGLEKAEWPGFVNVESSTARPTAQVVLAWEDRAPALALCRAGLGRVAVLAADAASPDAIVLMRWPATPQFLAQLVRALAEPPASGGDAIDVHFVETLDGRAFARIDVPGGGRVELDPVHAGATLSLGLEDRGGASQAELAAMPPAGVYGGTFATPGGSSRRAVAVSAGPRGGDPKAPRRIADAAGVSIVEKPPPPRDGKGERRREPCELPFVLGALGLLFVEAAMRRSARVGA